MTIGIIPNINKENILEVVAGFRAKLEAAGFHTYLSSRMLDLKAGFDNRLKKADFLSNTELCRKSDIVVSIGGDGTMLNTAFEAREADTPLLGVNFGKLGFLAEFEMSNIDELIKDIKDNNYYIEERMALGATCRDQNSESLFAINDLVIDKGRWPKMIEMTIKVDENYVSTFSADGIIVATPTGSTGYSLSTGGPIVNPAAAAITLSPISPHTLTMRPLVLAAEQKITITADSIFKGVQVSCDGQRVYNYGTPFTLEVQRSEKPVKLLHTRKTNYFEILRNKLFWGLDLRNNSNK